jgi:hypothetical protein
VLVIFSYVYTGMGWEGWWGCDAFVNFRGDDESEEGDEGERRGKGRMKEWGSI